MNAARDKLNFSEHFVAFMENIFVVELLLVDNLRVSKF